jgi:hypothetical protein
MPKHPADVLDTKPAQERVIIRSYPKVVVYYPTMLAAFLCALYTLFWPDAGGESSQLAGRVFFIMFFFNTLTIAFDFSRAAFFVLCLSLGLFLTLAYLAESKDIAVFDFLGRALGGIDLSAKPAFFVSYGAVFLLIFLGVYLQTRFNYWEIKHNELIHHHGVAGDSERYPAPNLRMSKEITDVFEYLLLFSGRLVLFPASAERPIVLDHVVRINAIEKRVETMLQTFQVSIQDQHGHGH